MRNQPRHKLGIGLTLALAATAFSGTGVMAFPAPADTTHAGAESIVPPDSTTPPSWLPAPVTDIFTRSPETGRNVRLPGFDSPLRQSDGNGTIVGRSPETGRNVRLPAS